MKTVIFFSFLISFCYFIFSDLVFLMIFLLLSSICMIVIMILELNLFWMSLLYGITVVSGLMIVFSYISSISPKSSNNFNFNLMLFLFSFFAFLVLFFINDNYLIEKKKTFFLENLNFNSFYLIESLFLFLLLFMLVILFLRLTYSKGGGFRKKY